MSKTVETVKLIGYVDYGKECFLDALLMLKGHFGIVASDPVIAEHFKQMTEYVWAEIQKECDTSDVDIEDVAVAYFAKPHRAQAENNPAITDTTE